MGKKMTMVQTNRLSMTSSFNKGMMGNASLFSLTRKGGCVERLQSEKALRALRFARPICLPLEYCLWKQSQNKEVK